MKMLPRPTPLTRAQLYLIVSPQMGPNLLNSPRLFIRYYSHEWDLNTILNRVLLNCCL
jgi:hypothetical protein